MPALSTVLAGIPTKRSRVVEQPHLPSFDVCGWEVTGHVLAGGVPRVDRAKNPRLEVADSLPALGFALESRRPERVTIAFAMQQFALVREHVSAEKIQGVFRSRLNASQREQIAAADESRCYEHAQLLGMLLSTPVTCTAGSNR